MVNCNYNEVVHILLSAEIIFDTQHKSDFELKMTLNSQYTLYAMPSHARQEASLMTMLEIYHIMTTLHCT